jgi:uncharacterized protein
MTRLKSFGPFGKIVTYLVLTLFFSLPFYFLIISSGSILKNQFLPLGLMWCPGISGLICSYIFGHHFEDIGFRRGKLKAYVVAYLTPLLVALFIFLGLLIFHLGDFEISPSLIEKKGSVENALLAAFLLGPLIGTATGFIAALGEEMGWRGFLYTQMHKLEIKYPDYLLGFIWSLWHWPLILFGDYTTSRVPFFSAVMFSLALTASGPLYGWLRGYSKSVFPVVLTHASHNLFIQGIYPIFLKKGPLDEFFGGESGVFCVLAYFLVAIAFHRKNKSVYINP